MPAKRKSGAKAKPRAAAKKKTPAKKQPAAKPKAKTKAKAAAKPKARAKPKAAAKPKRVARKPAVIEVEEAQILDATLSLAEIEMRAANAASLPPEERLALLAELEEAGFELEGQEMDRAHAAVQLAELALIKEAQDSDEVRRAFLAAVRAAPWKGHWIAALGTFGDDDSYQLVREMAQRQLEVEYYDTKPAWFFALGALAHRAQFAEDARAFILGAFEYLASRSRDATERKLVNAVAFGALAYVAAALPHPSTGPALLHAFRIAAGTADVNAHYELNVTCGPLAIALASVGHAEALPDIDKFLEDFDQYEGDAFIVQARYARWLLANDGAAAVAYLRDPEHGKSLGLVAAAIADLDYKPGRDALEERAFTLSNPVAQEAFAEALARLDKQFAPPFRDGRMIWMFGRRSPTEQALGEESDNVFVQRAMARTGDEELGMVYASEPPGEQVPLGDEADDSAVAD